jgi:predicted enzyme related to lactoylglutathione lyase
MLAKIQHVAIVSENFVRETKFYESVFGMKGRNPQPITRPSRASISIC